MAYAREHRCKLHIGMTGAGIVSGSERGLPRSLIEFVEISVSLNAPGAGPWPGRPIRGVMRRFMRSERGLDRESQPVVPLSAGPRRPPACPHSADQASGSIRLANDCCPIRSDASRSIHPAAGDRMARVGESEGGAVTYWRVGPASSRLSAVALSSFVREAQVASAMTQLGEISFHDAKGSRKFHPHGRYLARNQ